MVFESSWPTPTRPTPNPTPPCKMTIGPRRTRTFCVSVQGPCRFLRPHSPASSPAPRSVSYKLDTLHSSFVLFVQFPWQRQMCFCCLEISQILACSKMLNNENLATKQWVEIFRHYCIARQLTQNRKCLPC